MITFSEKEHIYDHNGHRPVSGTGFISKFEEEFNREYFLSRGALKELVPDFAEQKKAWKYSGGRILSQEFLEHLLEQVDIVDFIEGRDALAQAWVDKSELACFEGTEYHLAREHESYKRGYELNPFDGKEYPTIKKKKIKGVDNYSLAENLYDLEDGYYPELLVFLPEKIKIKNESGEETEHYWLVGQEDRVFIGTDEQGRFIDCDDIKTGKKPSKWSMRNEDTGIFAKLKYPVQHLMDCKHQRYELQTSLYSYMLECHGYRVRNNAYTHINELVHCEYRKKEIQDMIEYYKTNYLKV